MSQNIQHVRYISSRKTLAQGRLIVGDRQGQGSIPVVHAEGKTTFWSELNIRGNNYLMIMSDYFCYLCKKGLVVTPQLHCLKESVQIKGHNMLL